MDLEFNQQNVGNYIVCGILMFDYVRKVMEIIYKKNDILEKSGCSNVNFLVNDNKFYVMDNHLCASWCWEQKINTDYHYGLFHIDRHYDLLNSLSDDYLRTNHDLFIGKKIADFNSLSSADGIRFDNYIDAFCRLHPNLLIKAYYCTHQDGSDWHGMSLESISSDATDVRIWDLVDNIDYWIGETEIEHWILNIDLDFFFQGSEEEGYYRFLTSHYARKLCRSIRKVLNKIDVVTIALSPEFCNGWGPSFDVLHIFEDELGFKMPFKYCKIGGSENLL